MDRFGKWLGKTGWSIAVFLAGIMDILLAVFTKQDTATETAMVSLGTALVLVGPLLARIKGTIKLPGGVEIPVDTVDRDPEIRKLVVSALVAPQTVKTKSAVG